MYDDRRAAVLRQRRAPREVEAIVDNPLMSPEARNLLNHLLSKPPTFQINQRYVIRRGDYGGRDKVRRLFREMTLAGHCTADPERNPDGTFKRGIYLVSDQPRWLAAVDISDRAESHIEGSIAEGNTPDPAPDDQSVGIDNSIINPGTVTGPDHGESPRPATPLKAESRERGSKTDRTRKAERRTGGAPRLPEKEPGSRPARGLAMKGVCSGVGDQTANDRFIEQLKGRLVEAASFPGSRMPNPRKAAGAVPCLIQWRMEGLDFDFDVLPAIVEVCGRVGDPDKQIVSWRYFIGAIRDRREQRVAALKAAERPADPAQIDWWNRLTLYLDDEHHSWPAKWGPRPGEDGCLVPEDVIIKFSLEYSRHLERFPIPGLASTGAGFARR